jgi:hypothetical protein
LLYAVFGVRILSASLVSVGITVRDYAATAGGGVTAVGFSADVIFLPYVVLALASIIANRMLAPWARQSGGNIRTLHRTQRWSIVLAFAVALASIAGLTMAGGPLPFMLLPFSGVMWGLQFVLTAILLGFYSVRRGS